MSMFLLCVFAFGQDKNRLFSIFYLFLKYTFWYICSVNNKTDVDKSRKNKTIYS